MTSKRRWRNPDKRMAAAVRYREAGLSLRDIASNLGVTHTTVRRDLERYEQQSVEHLLEHFAVADTHNVPGDVP